MNSKYYNQRQKAIVQFCEEANYYGIRHKGLSGTVCEDVLINALRKDIPEYNVGRGVIKFNDHVGTEINSKKDLSTQIDIIIYKGKPSYNLHNTVAVNVDQVVGVIEVKKWLFPKNLQRAQIAVQKLKALIVNLNHKTNHDIKIFLVAIRFHDRFVRDINFYSELKKYPASKAYCFFSHYTKDANGRIFFPWEEKGWNDFDKTKYADQYEMLVKDIKELSSNVSID